MKKIFPSVVSKCLLICTLLISTMSADKQWQRDYSFSLPEDEKVIVAMSGLGYTGHHVDPSVKNTSYDAVFYKDHRKFTAEFKHDQRAAQTKQAFIETGNAKGKPSAITVSDASHYFICVDGLAHVVKTNELRGLLSKGFEWKKPTMGRLIKLADIRDLPSYKTFSYGDES